MIDKSEIFKALDKVSGVRVLHLGDVMLDRFVDGSVSRICPEAPVPVLLAGHERTMPGGAGNAAAALAALGALVDFIGVAGDDAAAGEIGGHFKRLKVGGEILRVATRATTEKTRFVSGAQYFLRVDREVSAPIDAATEKKALELAGRYAAGAAVIVLSDYNKGFLTDRLIAEVMKLGKPVVADPKGRDFARYRGAAFITPNEKELAAASGLKTGTDAEVEAACRKVMAECGIGAVLATRGAKGLSLVTDKGAVHIPASARVVNNVSGAGDTALAAFAAALGAGVSPDVAAALAGAAAGAVVEKPDTATVTAEEVRAAIEGQEAPVRIASEARAKIPGATKLMTREEAGAQAERWRAEGLTVGFTNGTFDLIHPGHISSIRAAKAACDRLVVAINSDASVKRYKGPDRPVQDEAMRATIMSALEMVDAVVIFEEDTPLECLRVIRPDVLVKGGQYRLEEIVGYDLLSSYGGRVIRADMEEGFSTTGTIRKMAGG